MEQIEVWGTLGVSTTVPAYVPLSLIQEGRTVHRHTSPADFLVLLYCPPLPSRVIQGKNPDFSDPQRFSFYVMSALHNGFQAYIRLTVIISKNSLSLVNVLEDSLDLLKSSITFLTKL